eukprot:196581_1
MDDDSDFDDDDAELLPKKKCTDLSIGDCGALYIYLRQNPKTFFASVLFFISFSCVLALGVSYLVDFHRHTCFFVAGVAGIVSNLYGFCHFRTLLNLKKEVDAYSTNNKLFKEENNLLLTEVDKFTKTKEALKATSKSIKDSIKRKEISLVKFRQLNTNLEATGKKNLEILKDLNQMAEAMENRWKEQLVAKERKILHICFDRFEWEGDNDGISREQFTQFKLTLPLEYQYRLTKAGDWETIAHGDGILQLNEFQTLLDNFAQEVVTTKHEKRMSSMDEIHKSDLDRIVQK